MNTVNHQKSKKEELTIGVDMGGTKIGIALVSSNGEIKDYLKTSTDAERGSDDVINKLKKNIHQMINQADIGVENISGIGIGVPGPLNSKTGIIHSAPNLPGWKEVPLGRIMREEFRMPVIIENDANAAAWGEKSFGIAQGIDDLICLTLGTGIGGGLILNGKIYDGKNFVAGEAGHIVVNKDGPRCHCGGYGCLEAYSSATGIKDRIYHKIEQIKKTDPGFIPNIDVNHIALAETFERARQGDPLVKDIVDDAIEYLGIGMVTLVNLLNPEMIVLVGGITNEGDKLLNPVKELVFHRAMKSHLKDLKIVFGKLGEYAGVAGAAALLQQSD
jgi:glucokinase